MPAVSTTDRISVTLTQGLTLALNHPIVSGITPASLLASGMNELALSLLEKVKGSTTSRLPIRSMTLVAGAETGQDDCLALEIDCTLTPILIVLRACESLMFPTNHSPLEYLHP
jgi:hypothetical protein